MSEPLMPDENLLLIRLRSGEAEAFEVLYHRHKRRIFYNILRLVHDREIAEELHQDVFLKIWERRDTIEPGKSFHFYLTRIAQNLAVDFYRKAARDKRLLEQLTRSATEHYDPIENQLHHKECREALHHAIVKLPPQRQKVFMLCKIEGKSYGYAARLLGVSVGTIKDHMAKASRFLKQELLKTELSILPLLLAAALIS